MFNAAIIVLSGDLTYGNVKILEKSDFDDYNIPLYFEDWTCAFIADGEIIQTHQNNINLIQLDRRHRKIGCFASQVVIYYEVKYSNCCIIPQYQWRDNGIPLFFSGYTGYTEQFVFSNIEGTFITLDCNIIAIINPKAPRPMRHPLTPTCRPQQLQKPPKKTFVAQERIPRKPSQK